MFLDQHGWLKSVVALQVLEPNCHGNWTDTCGAPVAFSMLWGVNMSRAQPHNPTQFVARTCQNTPESYGTLG